MNDYMDISEIEQAYKNGEYSCDIKIPEKVSLNHVFDEELSVRKNREMAIEHNKKADDIRIEYHTKVCELNRKLQNDVINYISNVYNMTKEQAHFIEGYVYAEKHSFMSDYFSSIDDAASLVEHVLNAKSE